MTKDRDDVEHRGLAAAATAVEQRLLQMRQLWERAAESYFSPDDFLLNLQTCVTTSRTVTFILQSNKAAISGFESWYERYTAKWKIDPIMEWAKNARNFIEKQGDLSVFSQIKASIIASYVGGPVTDWTPSSLFHSTEAIRASIPKQFLVPHVVQHGTLLIERRWVANSLPDIEILEAMSHVYGELAQLAIDLTQKAGKPNPSAFSHGLPEMMRTLAMDRAAYVSIADGATYGYRLFSRPVEDSTEAQKSVLEKRYGSIRSMRGLYSGNNLREQAESLFNVAKMMLVRDGYHDGMAFFICERSTNLVNVEFPNRAAKYVVIRELAKYAVAIGAKSVIMIAEAWSALADGVPASGFASEARNRGEALTLHAANDKGEHFSISAMFRRRVFNKNKVKKIEEAFFEIPNAHFIMFPFLEGWGALREEIRRAAKEAENSAAGNLSGHPQEC